MQFKRSDRVSELLRHEVALLVREIKNPKLGFVTITAVRLSDDLMDARVYFSVLGGEEDVKTSAAILKSSVPSMRHHLGRKLESLRKVPMLHFILDDTAEKAQKIFGILNHLADERGPEGSPGAPEQPESGAKAGD